MARKHFYQLFDVFALDSLILSKIFRIFVRVVAWWIVSVRYVVVVTAGPLCSQTHDRGLWGRITEAGVVLTPTAVSRVGIKI